MDTPADHLITNSCQYTPVYFIENPGVNQARSFVVTPNNQTAEKPVSENLKRFYENSGKLETNLTATDSSLKPRILKKPDGNVIGNNLKLASFLLPKSETKVESCKQTITAVNNVVLKPVYIANNLTPNSTPKLDVNSKIVKLKNLPNVIRAQNGKILPKIKPKENTSNNKSKHTSVQLLKLGETYHSLNQLSDDQMKIVNHALKIFSNPQNTPPEPTYDPVTNTKFIYKVVSPKDLAVVGKNKMNKQKRVEIKKEIVRNSETTETEDFQDQKVQLETKVTRSGRIVKLPRNMLPEESPNKPKRKNGQMTCLQCTSKFSSPHRLQRHYDNHPTHAKPTNLFQCLLAIVKTRSLDPVSFIQHLDQFVEKLRSSVPCLLKGEGQPSVVNDDVSRLLGINPGRYNINLDGLNCEKDKNGFCRHNRPVIETPKHTIVNNIVEPHEIPIINKVQILPTLIEKPIVVNKPINVVNSVTIASKSLNNIVINTSAVISQANIQKDTISQELPVFIKKVDKQMSNEIQKETAPILKEPIFIAKENKKHPSDWQMHDNEGKKIKLSSDNDFVDDIVALLNENKTENSDNSKTLDNLVLSEQKTEVPKSKPGHIQFRSTHFDIRSSPIKSSTVFRKFQINPEKMAKYEVEIIKPIQLNKLAQEIETSEICESIREEPSTNGTENFNLPETWPEEKTDFTNNSIIDQNDFLKTDGLIEPSLLHVKDNSIGENYEVTNDISASQGQSIISFLESLGNELSDTGIRNNSMDFQLDLFSFNNC